ncbi:MAG TPA: competence protein CoiA family protein [Planctomycetota bacterium]|nr:competence protein CoiA family protein [Planctomycetota bacterium]
MRELLVPFALSDGRWLRPGEAPDHGRFECPECRGRVVVREGSAVVRHFAHWRDAPSCRLSGESAEHVAAKYAVMAAVRRWKAGQAAAPAVVATCRGCGGTIEERPLRPVVADALLEVAVPGARLDVALVDARGKVSLGIEILHAHAVPADKGRARIPWIEVRSARILESLGGRLEPVRGNVRMPRECATCRRARGAALVSENARAAAASLAAPRSRFEASLADQATWTTRQRETLGRYFPRERMLRILAQLRRAYPRLGILRDFEDRLLLCGHLSPRQVAVVVRVAQRGPGRLSARPTSEEVALPES